MDTLNERGTVIQVFAGGDVTYGSQSDTYCIGGSTLGFKQSTPIVLLKENAGKESREK